MRRISGRSATGGAWWGNIRCRGKGRMSCRVGGWRASGRVRWRFRRFRAGPQSGSHGRVSSPRSPNPACGFPALGSPVGSCVSRTEHHDDSERPVIGFRISGTIHGSGTTSAPPFRLASGGSPSLLTPGQLRAFRSSLATIVWIGSFTFACDASGLLGLHSGL